MRELVWLDSAADDVVRLRDFIAKENPEAAKRAAKAIKDTAQRLIDFPEVGKPVQDLLQYRELFIRFGAGGYVLRYRIYSDIIYVVHIKHYRESSFQPSTAKEALTF